MARLSNSKDSTGEGLIQDECLRSEAGAQQGGELLLTGFMTSVNSFLRTLWSQLLVSSLLQHSMMLIFQNILSHVG